MLFVRSPSKYSCALNKRDILFRYFKADDFHNSCCGHKFNYQELSFFILTKVLVCNELTERFADSHLENKIFSIQVENTNQLFQRPIGTRQIDNG